jgi:hypothetical protein
MSTFCSAKAASLRERASPSSTNDASKSIGVDRSSESFARWFASAARTSKNAARGSTTTALSRAKAALWLPIIGACSVPPSDGRYSQQFLPDAATFPPVAELLDVRCGSLDCHGTTSQSAPLPRGGPIGSEIDEQRNA